jgi:DNA-binding PucR family transcriptional regulator
LVRAEVAHDQRRGTNACDTLLMFLEQAQNAKSTARALDIQRAVARPGVPE